MSLYNVKIRTFGENNTQGIISELPNVLVMGESEIEVYGMLMKEIEKYLESLGKEDERIEMKFW